MPPFSPSPVGSWLPHLHPNKRHALPPPQQHSSPACQNVPEATIGPGPIQIMMTRARSWRTRTRMTRLSRISDIHSATQPSRNGSCLTGEETTARRILEPVA
jgi:hypothetical protein